ncbi:MAG: hypothetical protein AB7S39_14980 [Gemmatimonadales bacterium]
MATTPQVLLRYSEDVGYELRGLARYIGSLDDEGRSKVSVNSSLSPNESEDYFRFQVKSDQFVRIRTGELLGEDGAGNEAAPDGTVRYQLLTQTGRVVADSNPDSGEAYEAWVKLTSDSNLELSKGSYTIRVARERGAVRAQEYIYSFTFRSGTDPITGDTPELASREFLTTERPAPAGAAFDQFANVTAILGLFADVRVI